MSPRRSHRAWLWLALALSLAACDEDTSGPGIPEPGACPGGTCEVRGVDLVLDDVRFESLPASGILEPGDTLLIHWSVSNRGDEASPATRIVFSYALEYFSSHEVESAVPVLLPGDTVGGATEIVLQPPAAIAGWGFMSLDTVRIHARLLDVSADPYFDNDSTSLPAFVLAAPILEGELTPLTGSIDSSGRPRLVPGDTLLWERRVWNHSAHVASPDTALSVCLGLSWGHGCDGTPAPLQPLPAIGAGDTLTDTISFAVSLDGLWDAEFVAWNGVERAGVYLCVTPIETDASPWWNQCFAWGAFRILPSFESHCEIAGIQAGESRTGAEAVDCSLGPSPRDVWRFDAIAGGVYDLIVPGQQIWILDPDGGDPVEGYGHLMHVATESGPVFIAVPSGEYTLTLDRRL